MDPQLLTAIGTILSVIVIALVRDWRDGKHPFKKNGKHDSSLEELKGIMVELQSHYNHDTTTVLKEIRDAVKENTKEIVTLGSELREHAGAENTKLDILLNRSN